MRMTGRVKAVVAAGILMLPISVFAQDLKIGVVNFDRLAANSPQVKEAEAKLQDEFAPKAREIQARQQALQTKADQFQKDAEVMGAAEREAAERELSTEQRAIMRSQNEFQEESQLRQRELLGPVQQKLIGEVQAYAQAEGYDLVVAEGAVYASDRVNITDAVIERLNSAAAE